jgi:predicted metal-dependent phosphoesterase TrpH
MNYTDPYARPGRWYRGNTHTHSSVSDGERSIVECFAGYEEQGYDFLVLTDHHEVSDVSRFSNGSFLAISGSELHPVNPYGGTTYHIVALNIHERIDTKRKHPNQVIAEIAGQGGISVLAHPYWSGHTLLDLLPLHGYSAVEVFNNTCDRIGRAVSEAHWDDLLDRAGPVFGIACDDTHFRNDLYRGWIMVKSSELSVEAILKSLVDGAFYSTQGPEIYEFRPEGGSEGSSDSIDCDAPERIVARFSEAASVVFKSAPCMGKHYRAEDDRPITEAVYQLTGDEKYVRLEITDRHGKKAWSQPITIRTV